MIAEECKKLRRQLEDVAKAADLENIVEQLGERLNELIDLRNKVLKVADSLKAIASRTKIVTKLDSSRCIEKLKTIHQALNSDPLSITKGRDFSLMKRAFENFIEDGSSAVVKTWEQYLPKAQPKVDMNQVAQAEQQDAFKSKALHLVSRAKHAVQIAMHPPATIRDLVELETVWEDIRTMITELPAVSNDPIVQEFLKAANSRMGAPLELLTDEVRKWLQDNNISDKYRITTM